MPTFDFPQIPQIDELDKLVKGICNNPKARRAMMEVMNNDKLCHPPAANGVHSLKITVPGEPVPKGRHRARIVQPKLKPAFIHFYQDADTEAYEKAVVWQAKRVMGGRGLLSGALRIDVVAYLKVPASWSVKQKERALVGDLVSGLLLPTSRPDADNFLKCCLDAMNGIVYKDDSQVTDMSVKKRYSDNPRLEIEIFPA